jgi:hypothetical protein
MTATRPLSQMTTLRAIQAALLLLVIVPVSAAAPRPDSYWQIDDIRPGMKGHGRTVIRGTTIESFNAEVLGVLKNTSPGRDMVLCRLSGLNLEKTGIIAGMSGSPVYINGRLLGAVAFAWAFGKEPIAGITPFCQMHNYVESYERRDLVEKESRGRITMIPPFTIEGTRYDSATVCSTANDARLAPDSLCMMPLQTPIAATGFTNHSLELLKTHFDDCSLVPMQAGGVSAKIADEEASVPLQPGSPMAVALVTGDFDLSGMGTVTHIEGQRIYGWGHPFFGIGTCEFPLMSGYIHAVYPRQSVSFKMGSPLRAVGVINADVSTCIAGWLDRKPDMLPVRMTVTRESDNIPKTFNVEVVRQRSLVAPLVYTVLTNSVDMEGELPEELTAELQARVEIEGHAPVVIQDTFSGLSYSGGRAPQALYSQVAGVVSLLTYNSYRPVRINRIECQTHIYRGRRTAEVEAIELNSDTFRPGESIKATVFVRPYKGLRQRLPVALKLPADLPDGNYVATVCDDLSNARQELRDNPNLSNPQDLNQVFEALKIQTSVRRTAIVLRVPVNAVGVALEGKSLPNLPPSMVQILATSRRTGAQTMGGALVSRQSTSWVVQGCESVHFTVSKNKKSQVEP